MRENIVKLLKKALVAMLTICLIMACFTGCGQAKTNKEYSIVCTIYPQYDWVRQILGERVSDYEITLLLQNGTDMHSYQPTAKDIAKIATCDMFIYVGGESDTWVADALKGAKNDNMKVINLMEVLGDDAIEEHTELEHDHAGHDHSEHDHAEGEVVYDEHVWLSLRNANTFVKKIQQDLEQIEPACADYFEKNAYELMQDISNLHSEIKDYIMGSEKNALVFADRFPFKYFVEDYSLEYHAAFPGCSAETEASFETIVNLAKEVDELKLSAICVLENSDKKLANTVKDNTSAKNQEIVTFDSMQSVTKKDIESGKTYMDYMKANFESLKNALK